MKERVSSKEEGFLGQQVSKWVRWRGGERERGEITGGDKERTKRG